MCLMAVSCIVVTASSLDALSLLLLDNAWGLQVSPHVAWVASCDAADAAAPGGCSARPVFAATAAAGGHILSCGYLLTVAITAPFALIEISETFQATAYFISLACLLQLICKFAAIAFFPTLAGGGVEAGPLATLPTPRLHAIGLDLGLVMMVSYWSWCISFAVPMWLDEKAEALPISRLLLLAFTHRAVLDLLLGFMGAAAFPRMGPQRLNVLDAVAVHPACGAVRGFACSCACQPEMLTAGTPRRAGDEDERRAFCHLEPGAKHSGVCTQPALPAPATPRLTRRARAQDYGMVAARNLECHVGRGAGNALGIVAPFAVAWRFYFGVSSPAAMWMRRPHSAALRMRRLHMRIAAAWCGTPADALAPRARFCDP